MEVIVELNELQLNVMNAVLESYRIHAPCEKYEKIRNVSFYDIRLAPVARVRDLEKYGKEVALTMRAKALPIFKEIIDQGIIRLQLVNDEPDKISFYDKIKTLTKPSDAILPFYLGESIEGTPLWVDFHQNPHLLIAGTTGSGKSTLLHTIIGNAIEHFNVHLIDTKQVEFCSYENKVSNITVDFSYTDAVARLEKIYFAMNKRYDMMRANKLSANYFSTPECVYPYTLVVIDEFADLILQDEDDRMYDIICKIAQKGRAAGIHLTIATQRPSVDVLRGALKANFPARIACKVSSRVDSTVILDAPGANCLMGKGDAIIKTNKYEYQRFQVAYSTPEENCSLIEEAGEDA